MSNDLQGRRALVTGSTTGLGRRIALTLARDGAEVFVHGRNTERGAETVDAILKAAGRAKFVAANLDTVENVTKLAEEVGDVDILVNNAGFSLWGPSAELADGDFDEIFASNVRAPYYLVAALAPAMVTRGQGSIVNIGSMSGSLGLPAGAAYGATKAALASLTQAWAAEYSRHNVRVNVVAAGPMHTRADEKETFDAMGATTPMKRAADPQEIAEVVAFLASARASYITGATIAVDGGRTAI